MLSPKTFRRTCAQLVFPKFFNSFFKILRAQRFVAESIGGPEAKNERGMIRNGFTQYKPGIDANIPPHPPEYPYESNDGPSNPNQMLRPEGSDALMESFWA